MTADNHESCDEKHRRLIEDLRMAEERALAQTQGMFPNPARRRVLLGTAAGAAGLLAHAASAAAPPGAKEWPVQQDPTREQGRTILDDGGYGTRSQFESEIRVLYPTPMPRTSLTPLAQAHGIITPSGLHFERHHAGIPNIDPKKHVFYVHGMVEKPMKFTLDDIRRLPSVSRILFIECSGNSAGEWSKPGLKTVQGTHGLSCTSEWTGVPVSLILSMCGVKDGAAWVMAEGADAAVVSRSIPLDKMFDDAIIAYGQNGEAVRPEQGYPMRLVLPGYEGNMSIKWLRRFVVSDKPFMTRWETSKYTDSLPSGKARQFSFAMEAKSVITFPSGEMKLPGAGFYEVTGLAWSGRAKIRRVEVSTDGGKSWRLASLQEPILAMAHTRFRMPWHWDGQPAVLQSRATDETGYVQPTIKQLREVRGTQSVSHNNGIQSWAVAADGSVSNVQVF